MLECEEKCTIFSFKYVFVLFPIAHQAGLDEIYMYEGGLFIIRTPIGVNIRKIHFLLIPTKIFVCHYET